MRGGVAEVDFSHELTQAFSKMQFSLSGANGLGAQKYWC